MSNGLDPDQSQLSVGPDLGPSCLQRLSADSKSLLWQAKSYSMSEHIGTYLIGRQTGLSMYVDEGSDK